MDDEAGIFREEVQLMLGALADISTDTQAILTILRGEEGDDEEEEADG